MVGFNHQSVVFITHLLSCHLTTVIVEQFQRITNGAVELANFLQASYLFDTSTLVLTWFKGLKIEFPSFISLVLVVELNLMTLELLFVLNYLP